MPAWRAKAEATTRSRIARLFEDRRKRDEQDQRDPGQAHRHVPPRAFLPLPDHPFRSLAALSSFHRFADIARRAAARAAPAT
jgi:hypothetical protein